MNISFLSETMGRDKSKFWALRRFRSQSVLVTCLLGQVLAGCAPPRKLNYSPLELRREVRRRAPAMAKADVVVPHEVAPEHLEIARHYITPFMSASERAKALLKAMFDPDGYGLRYTEVLTRTAEQTLAAGEGNCLALASVFVGLARGLGLKAYFLDASGRVEQAHSEQDVIIRTGHITAVVETERGRVAMDFGRRLSPFRIFRVMDDVEAAAHFHNNSGYELMVLARRAGEPIDWDRVAHHFEAATRVMPDFARAWNNLGVARLRQGRPKEAEAAYRKAARADPEFASPLTNLGILLMKSGRPAEAVTAFERAVLRESDNPRTHLHLAQALLAAGHPDRAARALEQALKWEPDHEPARRLLVQVYRHLGRDEDADRLARDPGHEPGS